MPLPGTRQTSAAVGGTVIGVRVPRDAAGEFQGKIRDMNRMNLPPTPAPIRKMSQDEQVYIYNVSPWTYQQPMGSYGTFTIPGLPENQVSGELTVAGPLIVPGLPMEHYPADGTAKQLWHQPREGFGREEERPGFDFALEILGEGRNVTPGQSLRLRGVFISTQVEQQAQKDKSDKALAAAYERWVSDVKTAKAALRNFCVTSCQEANIEHSRGRFHEVRNDQVYQMARIINGTSLEYKWLTDTAEAAKSKACWSCQTPLSELAFRCKACGELQVSKERFEEIKAEREKMHL